MTARCTVDETMAREFLAGRRIAVVGASDDPHSFGNTVFRKLLYHGYDAVPVNVGADTVAGVPCHASLIQVPGELDGVIVMVARDRSLPVVRECAARGVPMVWLFKGLGAPGAVSDDALAACANEDIRVVPGACPMMFLEPVGWAHRLHRAARRRNGSLAPVRVRKH